MAVGAVAGCALRYGLGEAIPVTGEQWPWHTLIANYLGALILGVIVGGLVHARWRPETRLIGGVGFCGGLTTYSAFALEADRLFAAGDPGLAVGYLAATVIGGLVLAATGIAVATRILR